MLRPTNGSTPRTTNDKGRLSKDEIEPMVSEAEFELSADGILNVSAVDQASGNSQQITIANDKGRLPKDEIERMFSEADFELSADGIRNVSAVDQASGNSQQITIANDKGRLSKDEIELLQFGVKTPQKHHHE